MSLVEIVATIGYVPRMIIEGPVLSLYLRTSSVSPKKGKESVA
jgi:hypothetical protein